MFGFQESVAQADAAMVRQHNNLIQAELLNQKESRKQFAQEQLKKAALEIKQAPPNADKLQKIFPKEIWLMVLNNLSNDHKANAALACPFFKILLGDHGRSWLFANCLPNFIEYLNYNDLVNCSKAYPKWRSAILNLTEQTLVNSEHIAENRKPFQGQYKTEKIQIDRQFVQTYTSRNYIEIPGQPNSSNLSTEIADLFFGARVTVSVSHHSDFFEKFANFLNTHGSKIQHLKLLGSKINISPGMIYTLCQQTLSKCKNLKSLSIKGFEGVHWIYSEVEILENIMAKPALSDHAHLETLTLNFEKPECVVIVHLLLAKYGAQLKKVDILLAGRPYYNLYQQFECNNITDLLITSAANENLIQLVELKKFTNLQILRAEVSPSTNLSKMISLLSHYPRVHLVDFRLCRNCCGWSNNPIVQVLPTQCAQNNVQTLMLTFSQEQTSFEFLICFPKLKNLFLNFGISSEIHDNRKHFNRVSHNDEFVPDSLEFGVSEVDQPLNRSVHENCSFRNLNKCILLNKQYIGHTQQQKFSQMFQHQPRWIHLDMIYCYSGRNDKKISGVNEAYSSRIWQALPYLQAIHIDEKTYSREQHKWMHLDYSSMMRQRLSAIQMQVQWHRDQIKKRREYEIETNKKLLQKGCQQEFLDSNTSISNQQTCEPFTNLKNGKAATSKATKINSENLIDKKFFSEVFPLVFSKLAKRDVLNCRATCVQGQIAVDTFLDTALCTQSTLAKSPDFYEAFPFWHSLNLSDSLPEQLLRHERNPFVGRSLQVTWNIETVLTLSKFLKTISKFALEIWHLSLSFQGTGSIDTLAYYKFCLEILQNFLNLKSLSIGHVPVFWVSHYRTPVNFSVGENSLSPVTSLRFDHNQNAAYIQAEFIQLFSKQLKCLVVNCNGNEDFLVREFSGKEILEELVLPNAWRLNLLKHLNTRNLLSLSYSLKGHKDDNKFLNSLTGVGPALKLLNLKVYKSFGGITTTVIKNVRADHFSTATTLVLTIEDKFQINFDFLIFFPLLTKLVVRYGSWVNHWLFSDKDYSATLKNETEESVLIKFTHCLQEEVIPEKIYSSNIWQVLGKLETIEFVQGTEIREKENCTVFTRQKYETYHESL